MFKQFALALLSMAVVSAHHHDHKDKPHHDHKDKPHHDHKDKSDNDDDAEMEDREPRMTLSYAANDMHSLELEPEVPIHLKLSTEGIRHSDGHYKGHDHCFWMLFPPTEDNKLDGFSITCEGKAEESKWKVLADAYEVSKGREAIEVPFVNSCDWTADATPFDPEDIDDPREIVLVEVRFFQEKPAPAPQSI